MDNFSSPRGPEGVGGHVPHREELLVGPDLHLMPADQSWGRTGGSRGLLSFVPESWRQVPRIKSDAGEVRGGGAQGNCSVNKICDGTQKSLPSSLVSRAEFSPPWPPPSHQHEVGAANWEKCPHSKNMSTNSKWTPGGSPPFKCSFDLSATALSPLGLQEPSSFFTEKGGGG